LTWPKGKPRPRLTEENVAAIYLSVDIGVQDHVILKHFGVDEATVWRIWNGEQWWCPEFTADDVRAIRMRLADGASCEVVGREFGTTGAHIARIRGRKGRKHV